MSEDLFIPKLGQTVEEVVLINWLVEDGAKVDFGDPVLEVETDKAIFNVEANAKGYIHFGPFEMGATVPVLTVVATIGKAEETFSTADEAPQEETTEKESKVNKPAPTEEITKDVSVKSPTDQEKTFASPRAKKLAHEKSVDLSRVIPTGGEGTRVVEQDVVDFLKLTPKATPIADALAKEVGLDITGVVGTGTKGVISRSDVEKAIREQLSTGIYQRVTEAPQVKYSPIAIEERQPLRSVRKLIFDRMAASDQLTARVTLITEADATDLVALREKIKEEKAGAWGFTPGYNDLIGLIAAHTLKDFSYMNARLSSDGKSYDILRDVNLGVAVDTERGLLVPVIKSANKMDLKEFGETFRGLVEKSQSGKISPEDLEGGTFTITNLGNFDIDAFTPIINLPEVAILGIGRIKDMVVAKNDAIMIRKMVTLSLVFDHRLIDGVPAARFLQGIKAQIEDPSHVFG
ncbi:MAG: 2-oxo acid dehydrogenase subunit E2 [Chloroflexota bacterium]|nr:2-oxo acid dehydrogenase subunit E2 [Chloroflexota bacterium]